MNAEPDRLRIGDAVTLPGLAVTFEVIALQGPRGLQLRAPSGRLVEADALAVSRLPRRSDSPAPRPAVHG